MNRSRSDKTRLLTALTLTLAALGVVYGDIGTSPLYALKEAFRYVEVSKENILGIVSLMFWAMTMVVTVKYVLLLLDTNHHGEGGITALIGLIKKRVAMPYVILGIFGVALLFGDGMITPAISVLSAVEGLELVAPNAASYVVPVTVLILIVLFSVQRYGTQKVGQAFGPIMILWFVVVGSLGVRGILQHPSVFEALNPYWGMKFFLQNGLMGFLTLGAVVLCITGGEALYADMGHFNTAEVESDKPVDKIFNWLKPVRLGWLILAYPCLVLNYLGQAGILIEEPEVVEQPFYNLAPVWLQTPLVVLATIATVIASQALITGAFSLTKSLVDLHAIPPIQIVGTSRENHGQIYVPMVNKILLFGCVALVLFYQNSSGLAAAYGIAVTGTMAITTWLWYLALVNVKGWGKVEARILLVLFATIDVAFFVANTAKFFDGGWIPLSIALILTIGMEWYYFHSRSLLRMKKQPITNHPVEQLNFEPSAVIIFVEDYVSYGSRLLLGNARRNFGDMCRIVHIGTNPERVKHLKEHLRELGEEVEVIPSPSGDLLRPAKEFVQSVADKADGSVWVFIGHTVERGTRIEGLHPNADALTAILQEMKGVVVVRVPWVAEQH